MDRIAVVLRFQWRAYWRLFRRAGNVSTSNAGVLVLFGAIGVFRYLQQLPAIAAQLARGETQKYETALTMVFLVWMLPVLGESRRTISSNALLHTPLSPRDLFVIRFVSIFISPVAWIVIAASLALAYPIARAANPAAGIIALFLFLLFSLAISLTIVHLLSNRSTRKWLVAAVIVFSAVLLSGTRLPVDLSWMPHRLAAEATVAAKQFGPLAALALMTLISFALSMWTFNGALQPAQTRRSKRFTFFRLVTLPGRFGGLLKKDLKYLVRLLDLYLALPVVVLLSIYLASAPDASAGVFRVILVLLFLPLLSIPSNCFGLDSPSGLDRYTLLPLTGREILLTKNVAFVLLVVFLLGALVPLAFWRFGASVVALAFIEVTIMALAYLSWGNWMSVRDPYRMLFYRFSSGGSPVDALMGLIFGSLPGLLMTYLLYTENYRAIWKIVLLIVVYVALYYFSLTRSARRFEERREEISAAL